MSMYEVDLRDRNTGDSIECIYSGDNYNKAYNIADNYNKKLYDFNEDKSFSDYQDGTPGLFADFFYVDEESSCGLGKFSEKKNEL